MRYCWCKFWNIFLHGISLKLEPNFNLTWYQRTKEFRQKNRLIWTLRYLSLKAAGQICWVQGIWNIICLFLTLICQRNGAAIVIHCVLAAQSHDLCMTCGCVCEGENPTGTSCCGTKTKTNICQNRELSKKFDSSDLWILKNSFWLSFPRCSRYWLETCWSYSWGQELPCVKIWSQWQF